MTGDHRQREVDPRIARAVTLILGLPLRWADSDGGSSEDSVLARGWFQGADECARVLASQMRLENRGGGGFGAGWPILRSGAWTISPAMPVAVSGETVVGVDGEYRGDANGVWREAGGAEELFLTTDLSGPAPGTPFDLLWFGDFERFTVRDGTLEIEDLFGTLRVPGSQQVLDRLLVRSRRTEGEALVGLPMADRSGPQTVEVRRPENLSPNDRWRDATSFLAARADIKSATTRGAIVEARTVGGATAIFGCDQSVDGWALTLREGNYVFTEICAVHRAKSLSLCATLDRGIDALTPGMRGRLIFDLRTDLVTLG